MVVKHVNEVIPVGLEEGWPFDLIHSMGLICLSLSFICCLIVLYLICMRHSKIRSIKGIFARPIGERLVIYLATCNLLYCISHIMDHSYMLAVRGNPPDAACAAFAFFLNEFVIAQSLVVTFTAINAFVMVVKETKVPLGKYDWALFVISLGVPLIIGILGVSTQHFGPSGLWCYMDHRTRLGTLLTNVIGIVMLVTFTFNIACYSAVWIKLKQAARKMGKDGDSKYTRSARTMMLFVAVYIFQWWSYVIYACWLLAGDPHLSIMVCATSFSNLGGLYNLITYVLMRRQKQAKVGDNKGTTKPTTKVTLRSQPKDEETKDKSKLIAAQKTTSDQSSASA